MLLQNYLRSGKTLDHLAEEFAIKAKRHSRYPELVLFKYNQIDSPMSESIVKECRGVILNEADNWSVVARPYDKFFNYGEGHASEIKWETAKVYEKLDGSLMTLYYYKDEWHVASSGVPDASGSISDPGITFEELFWKTWNNLNYKLPDASLSDHAFMFELMTPCNVVVVNHVESRLVLHGVRTTSGIEFDPDSFAKAHNWECVKTFSITNWDECLKASAALNGAYCEGYIVCDGQFNRNKVKCPTYVALHHLKEGVSLRRILEIVRGAESDEVLAHFKEFKLIHDQVKAKYDALVEEIDHAYESIQCIESQKEFALEATKHTFHGILFSMRKHKISSKECLYQMNIKHLMGILQLEDVSLVEENVQ